MSQPTHAAGIWIVGDELVLSLPGVQGAREHQVKIRADGNGMLVLRHVLSARARDAAVEDNLKIGHAAAPIQYDVDAMLKAMNGSITKVPPVQRKDAATVHSLEDLDL